MTIPRALIIKKRLDRLATYSDRSDCLSREFGSKATMAVNQLVSRWMRAVGLRVRIDNIGNVRGFRDNKKSKVFLMGSHLDTVIDAGKFDGPLGVLMAIDQAKHIDFSVFPYDFEAVGFANEEGSRFEKCYLGSQVVAGGFEESWLQDKDLNAISLEQAIKTIGGLPERVKSDAIAPQNLAGYFEVHIEQGPVLENINYPVGVVSHISAQQRHLVTIKGYAGHAGTVPMDERKDALTGASEFILSVEKIAGKFPSMVATVGRLILAPGTINVIPQLVKLSIDIRHYQPEELKQAVRDLKKSIKQICSRRNLSFDWEVVQAEEGVICDPEFTKKLQRSVEGSRLPLKTMASGAGHDAVAMSKAAPVSMLFVRCREGISHHPSEEASVEDIASAIKVCDRFFQSF